MTNELFRDYLDGRIPDFRDKPKPPPPTFAEALQGAADMVAACFASIFDAFTPLMNVLQDAGVVERPLPTEPRARALAAKQQQGHGPPPGVWRGQDGNTISRSQLKVGSPRALGTNRRHGRPPSDRVGGVGA